MFALSAGNRRYKMRPAEVCTNVIPCTRKPLPPQCDWIVSKLWGFVIFFVKTPPYKRRPDGPRNPKATRLRDNRAIVDQTANAISRFRSLYVSPRRPAAALRLKMPDVRVDETAEDWHTQIVPTKAREMLLCVTHENEFLSPERMAALVGCKPKSLWRFARRPDTTTRPLDSRGGMVAITGAELDSTWSP